MSEIDVEASMSQALDEARIGQFRVEPSYEGEGAAYNCVNPRFFDCTDAGPEGLRAFDLRNALS